jgi:PEP-CTERM motif
MTIMVRRILMLVAAAVLLTGLVQTASADTVVFTCGSCSGVISSPPLRTLTPIGGLTTSTIPSLVGDVFNFSFNISDPNSPRLADASNDEILTGTISALLSNDPSVSGSASFNVLWNLSTAVDVRNAFTGSLFSGPTMVTFEPFNLPGSGTVDTATLTIRGASPVPEPGSIALLGTGLLLCGWLLRRKKHSEEAASEAL